MKKIIFITAILISAFSYSQKNLELNDVLFLQQRIDGSDFIVPAGKVWKIVSMGSSLNNSTNGYAVNVYIDGQVIVFNHGVSSYGILLPSGTEIKFWNNNDNWYLNIIEYNLVQE